VKILHLPGSFLPYKTGGKELFTFLLARQQRLRGYDAWVLLHNSSIRLNYEYQDVPVYVLPSVVKKQPYLQWFTSVVDAFPGFENT
jgi:hypothetical protein